MLRRAWKIMTVLIIISVSLLTAKDIERHETFTGITAVDIKTTSGDCMIKSANVDEVTVDLVYSVVPIEAFEPEMRTSGSTLKIKENWSGSSSGSVFWTITVPVKTQIEFSTASGDFTAEGLKGDVEIGTASGEVSIQDVEGDVEASTASGDITVNNVRGDIELSCASGEISGENISGDIQLNTASGDIDIKGGKGVFEVHCASGDIDAEDIEITEASSFSAASGDVEVSLAESPRFDLELSAASGNVVLNYKGHDIRGSVVFETRKSGAKITSPFPFDGEEEFEKSGRTYIRKMLMRGSTPEIKLSSGSGRVVLKQ